MVNYPGRDSLRRVVPAFEEVLVDEFKERQRTMSAAGDYATLSTHIKHVGERVVFR